MAPLLFLPEALALCNLTTMDPTLRKEVGVAEEKNCLNSMGASTIS